MEPGRNPPRKGLTCFRSLQIVNSVHEPYEVRSIDLLAPRGVPGRLTGFFGSEALFIAEIHKRLIKGSQSLRFLTIYTDGGDLQPHPKSLEELAQKKMVALDTCTSHFMRSLVQDILDIPIERDSFAPLLGKEPGILNRLWEHEYFAHVIAFQWRCDFTLRKGTHFPGMRLITLKDTSSIQFVQCVDPGIQSKDISIVCYPEKT